MAIAIYARQSIDKKDSLSIETQIKECKAISTNDDNIITYEDRGYSGKNTERPNLQKMIEEIALGKIEKVIVYKLDRISRNIVDFYNLYDFMQKNDCAFLSVKDNFDTSTPMGRLLMGILINFAQMERENIQVRVQSSYYARAEADGRWLGGKTPFGFKLAKDKQGISTLKHTDDMQIIKILYEKYAYDSNCSLHKLSEFLTKNYGIIKTATAINNILSNPIYVMADKKIYNYYKSLGVDFITEEERWNGKNACQILNKTDQSGNKTIFNDTADWKVYITNWQGIIDSRTFLLVQERLKQNISLSRDNTPTGKFKELSGLVKCAKCNRAVKIKGKYGTMSCIGRSELRGVCNASFRGVRLEKIQAQVNIEIQNYLNNFMENQLKYQQKRNEYNAQIEKISTEISNLVALLAENPSISKNLIAGIEERQKQLADINYKLQLDVAPSDKIEYRVMKALQRTDKKIQLIKEVNYAELATEEKQALLHILVNKILLNENGKIKIDWKI